MEDLAGHTALITGAGRGIGRSAALALAAAGADVVVSARTHDEIQQVAQEVTALGRKSLAVICDVTRPEQISEMAAAAKQTFGVVDILVNNAGAAKSHKFLNHPDSLWEDMLSINLSSVYYVTKAFAPDMVAKGWGRIINIASVASKVGGRYVAAYTAAKHGVLGLTRALALEFATQGITVNAVCPGYVDTPMTDGSIQNIAARTGMSEAEARTTLEKLSPQNRIVEVDEIAAMVVFLATNAARGINGQGINIDGGSAMF